MHRMPSLINSDPLEKAADFHQFSPSNIHPTHMRYNIFFDKLEFEFRSIIEDSVALTQIAPQSTQTCDFFSK